MVKKIADKFIRGLGSVIDIMPGKGYQIASYPQHENTADRLSRDWIAIGKDIQKVISAQPDDIKKQAS